MTDLPKPKRRAAPLSVRFSKAERDRLSELAAGRPLGLFIRERALAGQTEPRRVCRARRDPIKGGEALGRLLGLLGQSRLANNLNQLAKAANQGSLPVTKEVETELQAACAEVHEMRQLLLRALGIVILDEVKDHTPLPQVFSTAAGAD